MELSLLVVKETTVSMCTFTSNQINALFEDGLTLFVNSISDSSSIVSLSAFMSNQVNSPHRAGGAPFVRGTGNLTAFVDDCTFMNNQINNVMEEQYLLPFQTSLAMLAHAPLLIDKALLCPNGPFI